MATWMVVASVMATSCGGDSFREPQDAVDGYSVQTKFQKWIITNLDGTEAFEGKTIINDDGNSFDGGRISFKKYVSASVNGFYKIGGLHYDREGYFLLSKELDKDNKLVQLGPFASVGMFYEDVTPAVRNEGEEIVYINRKGETAFKVNESTGLEVSSAYNFMGGLSVITINVQDIPLYGAVNTQGELVIPAKYITLDYIGSGLYYAIDYQQVVEKELNDCDVKILDNTGKEMFTFKKKDYYFIQSNGTTPFWFTFVDGYGILSNYSGHEWIIVDRKGKEVLKSDGSKLLDKENRAGKYVIFYDTENSKYGIMDVHGKEIAKATYSYIHLIDKDCFFGRKDGESKVYTYSGEVLFESDRAPLPFKEGYSVMLNQGWCEFINTHGEEVNLHKRYSDFSWYDYNLMTPVYFSNKK